MTVKIYFKGLPKPGTKSNGLDALEKLVRDSDGTQYVVLAVVPRKTIIDRGDERSVDVELGVLAIEPMVTRTDRMTVERLYLSANRARIAGTNADQDEIDLQFDSDTDEDQQDA